MNKSKINLIIFHPYSDIGGADLSISKLINSLDHKKYKIEFICLANFKKIFEYKNLILSSLFWGLFLLNKGYQI